MVGLIQPVEGLNGKKLTSFSEEGALRADHISDPSCNSFLGSLGCQPTLQILDLLSLHLSQFLKLNL